MTTARKKPSSSKPLSASAQRAAVRKIIHRYDWARIDEVGGYETEWIIENGKVYWADLDEKKEYAATILRVQPVAKFIAEHREVLDDDEGLWSNNDELGSGAA